MACVFTYHNSLKYLFDQKYLNLRQKGWMKLINYYNSMIEYHPDLANVIVDALSHKHYGQLSLLQEVHLPILVELRKIGVQLEMENSGTLLPYFQVRPVHVNRVRLASKQ